MRPALTSVVLPAVYCSVLLFVAGCATVHRIDGTKVPTISAAEAQNQPAKWAEARQHIAEGKPVIIRIGAGEKVPFKVRMNSPLVTYDSGTNPVIFTRETYVLIAPTVFRVSPDGQRWADIDDIRAQKKLFGIEHGNISFGLNVAGKEGLEMFLDLKAQ